MELVAELTGSGILGGLFGALGSGLGRLVGIAEMRERRQDRNLEMVHEKALWAHELNLQNLQARARAEETEKALKLGEQAQAAAYADGSWKGLAESIKADGGLEPSYPWVGAIRALVRPMLTLLIWLAFTTLFLAVLSARLPLSNASEIITTFVNSIAFAASTALAWWFGDRGPRPRGI